MPIKVRIKLFAGQCAGEFVSAPDMEELKQFKESLDSAEVCIIYPLGSRILLIKKGRK